MIVCKKFLSVLSSIIFLSTLHAYQQGYPPYAYAPQYYGQAGHQLTYYDPNTGQCYYPAHFAQPMYTGVHPSQLLSSASSFSENNKSCVTIADQQLDLKLPWDYTRTFSGTGQTLEQMLHKDGNVILFKSGPVLRHIGTIRNIASMRHTLTLFNVTSDSDGTYHSAEITDIAMKNTLLDKLRAIEHCHSNDFTRSETAQALSVQLLASSHLSLPSTPTPSPTASSASSQHSLSVSSPNHVEPQIVDSTSSLTDSVAPLSNRPEQPPLKENILAEESNPLLSPAAPLDNTLPPRSYAAVATASVALAPVATQNLLLSTAPISSGRSTPSKESTTDQDNIPLSSPSLLDRSSSALSIIAAITVPSRLAAAAADENSEEDAADNDDASDNDVPKDPQSLSSTLEPVQPEQNTTTQSAKEKKQEKKKKKNKKNKKKVPTLDQACAAADSERSAIISTITEAARKITSPGRMSAPECAALKKTILSNPQNYHLALKEDSSEETAYKTALACVAGAIFGDIKTDFKKNCRVLFNYLFPEGLSVTVTSTSEITEAIDFTLTTTSPEEFIRALDTMEELKKKKLSTKVTISDEEQVVIKSIFNSHLEVLSAKHYEHLLNICRFSPSDLSFAQRLQECTKRRFPTNTFLNERATNLAQVLYIQEQENAFLLSPSRATFNSFYKIFCSSEDDIPTVEIETPEPIIVFMSPLPMFYHNFVATTQAANQAEITVCCQTIKFVEEHFESLSVITLHDLSTWIAMPTMRTLFSQPLPDARTFEKTLTQKLPLIPSKPASTYDIREMTRRCEQIVFMNNNVPEMRPLGAVIARHLLPMIEGMQASLPKPERTKLSYLSNLLHVSNPGTPAEQRVQALEYCILYIQNNTDIPLQERNMIQLLLLQRAFTDNIISTDERNVFFRRTLHKLSKEDVKLDAPDSSIPAFEITPLSHLCKAYSSFKQGPQSESLFHTPPANFLVVPKTRKSFFTIAQKATTQNKQEFTLGVLLYLVDVLHYLDKNRSKIPNFASSTEEILRNIESIYRELPHFVKTYGMFAYPDILTKYSLVPTVARVDEV